MAHEVKWLGDVPETCDLCQQPMNRILNKQWFVDGKISLRHVAAGRWANMCPRCFEMYGEGLGLGKGQKYDLNTSIKLEG